MALIEEATETTHHFRSPETVRWKVFLYLLLGGTVAYLYFAAVLPNLVAQKEVLQIVLSALTYAAVLVGGFLLATYERSLVVDLEHQEFRFNENLKTLDKNRISFSDLSAYEVETFWHNDEGSKTHLGNVYLKTQSGLRVKLFAESFSDEEARGLATRLNEIVPSKVIVIALE